MMVVILIFDWLVLRPWRRQMELERERRLEWDRFQGLDAQLSGLASAFILEAAEEGAWGFQLNSKLDEIRDLLEPASPYRGVHRALFDFVRSSESFLSARGPRGQLVDAKAELDAMLLTYERLSVERSLVFAQLV